MAWFNPATWTAVDRLQGQSTGRDRVTEQGSGNIPIPADSPRGLGTGVIPMGQQVPAGYSRLNGGAVVYQNGGQDDPAYQAQQASAQAAARSGIMDEKQGYLDSVGGQIDQYGRRYGNSITDYLSDMRTGQNKIDTMGAKNELARNQGQAGVIGMVGRGIQSTGVMLGNKNAGDSSAAGALAGAYGQLGQRQMANVGNQYELGNMDINQEQDQFNNQAGRQKRDMELGKQEFVTSLVNDTQAKMAQLNARLVDASLPDRIAIEQEKASIRDRANSALQQFDQQLVSGFQGISPSSIDQRRTMAQDLLQRGTDLGQEAFNFTQQAPMQFQGNAPSGGNLPLFTLPRRRR
jgi:hypothetical protein